MPGAADLARRLAREAEAVCRHYLSKGCRRGHYWLVGDAMNTPGRSLYVRLSGPDYGPGAAGKWTDAATGEHGDLLDLIALNRDLSSVGDAMDEGRCFLSLPRTDIARNGSPRSVSSPDAARRLFNAGRPVPGTLAETYLRARGIIAPLDWPALRFHPSAYYRETRSASRQAWPALLAAVTDLEGYITGIQRTWLDPHTGMKAPITDPRRALGHLLGNGVRFGIPEDVLVAGEGIETMLSLKSVLPTLPMIAGLSANHLAALQLPGSLRRLYVALDKDASGRHAGERLHQRADPTIEVRSLTPVFADFNLDLCRLGAAELLAHLTDQLVPDDLVRSAPEKSP